MTPALAKPREAPHLDVLMTIEIEKLLQGDASYVLANTQTTKSDFESQKKCIFPGSFNPIHKGHLEMARIASLKTGLTVWYEISVSNVEKLTIGLSEINSRLEQTFGHEGIVITMAPTFDQKSSLFPGATFIVGADTIRRINQTKFYKSQSYKSKVFERFQERGCRFLVFGRELEGVFQSDNVELDDALRAICDFVPRSNFELRVSSTEIRSRISNRPNDV